MKRNFGKCWTLNKPEFFVSKTFLILIQSYLINSKKNYQKYLNNKSIKLNLSFSIFFLLHKMKIMNIFDTIDSIHNSSKSKKLFLGCKKNRK